VLFIAGAKNFLEQNSSGGYRLARSIRWIREQFDRLLTEFSPHRGEGEVLSLCFALDRMKCSDKIGYPISGATGAGRVR
jgi:hypothetical protein